MILHSNILRAKSRLKCYPLLLITVCSTVAQLHHEIVIITLKWPYRFVTFVKKQSTMCVLSHCCTVWITVTKSSHGSTDVSETSMRKKHVFFSLSTNHREKRSKISLSLRFMNV